jgi:hypothetical protein
LNPVSKVQASSNISITKDFNLNGTTLEMDGLTLNIDGWLYNGFINNTTLHNGYLQNINSLGNLVIEGLVTAETNNVFQNSVVVNDTLQSKEYGGGSIVYTVKIEGNVRNNGVIKNYSADDQLALQISGNIENYGFWSCYAVNLNGITTQNLRQGQGSQFDCRISDIDAGSKMKALSDLTVTKDFNLNGSTLEMEGHKLTMGGWLYQGFINNTTLHNGYLQNITSLGNLTLEGLVTVEAGNVFKKSVVVNDTLQSKEYGGGSINYTLKIEGNIQNNGVVRNISTDDQLSLEISGDVDNNGEWLNGFTMFSGTNSHHLSSLTGHILNGEFSDLDSIGSITVNTDVEFSGNFNLGTAILDMQNNAITFNKDRWVSNGYLKNARLRNGMLSHIRLSGETEINGRVELSEGNYASGNLTVNDTLTVIAYGGGSAAYTFVVQGNIMNKGLVGQMYDDGLYIKVSGNIINEGVWNAWRNYFLFYSNINNCSLTCTNKGNTDLQVNGSEITGPQANAFPIISGGGMQTIVLDQSYSLTIQFVPDGQDASAHLTLACDQVGTLNNIDLIGFNYETEFVGDKNNVPVSNSIILKQNYPNPFNLGTKISWQSPVGGWQTLRIFDVNGTEITKLVDEYKPAGSYETEFNTKALASGVYFYQLKNGNSIQTKKMFLIK